MRVTLSRAGTAVGARATARAKGRRARGRAAGMRVVAPSASASEQRRGRRRAEWRILGRAWRANRLGRGNDSC